MEPRIQYAQTKDRVSIAYWTMGEGIPLVYVPNLLWNHSQLEWGFPEISGWFERLAERRMLVRFDPRGTGLSQRAVEEYSLEALELDLEAVVERLGLKRFALIGELNAGVVATAYAAHHPDLVSHLILWCAWIRTSDTKGPRMQALEALQATMEKDWETYTEARAHMGVGWSEGELAHRYAAFMRECVSPEMAWRVYRTLDDVDVGSLLNQVVAPTLVLHRRQLYFFDVEVARMLTAGLPDARLALLEGAAAAPYLGDVEAVLMAIEEFLGVAKRADVQRSPLFPEGTAVILFLDIADSTALTTKLGDAAYREKERELDTSLRAAITDAGGTPVEGKVLGDGVMAVFTSARQAIEAAVRCRDLGNEAGLPLHLGIHAGDVVREGNNVHGGAVQVASRVQSAAAPGEVLVSATVRDLARTSAGVAFEDRGEHELKGIAEPQRLYAVREQG